MEGPSASALEAHGYRVLGAIGRGSQGAVYTVADSAGSTYVLKRMHIMEPEARRTALLEAETLQRLHHTAVIGYRDCFVDDEHLCLVMEYGDGGDLGSRIFNASRAFSEEQVLSWIAQLALALQHVHERGVLHRDLKTQNVFLTSAGHVKLGDFGIARVLNGAEPLAATCEPPAQAMAPAHNAGGLWWRRRRMSACHAIACSTKHIAGPPPSVPDVVRPHMHMHAHPSNGLSETAPRPQGPGPSALAHWPPRGLFSRALRSSHAPFFFTLLSVSHPPLLAFPWLSSSPS